MSYESPVSKYNERYIQYHRISGHFLITPDRL